MPRYSIRDHRTGDSFSFDWDKPNPPTKNDVRGLVDEHRRRASMSLWDKLNEPLTDAPSRWAKERAMAVTTPQLSDQDSPWNPYIKGFVGGATEGIGDILSSLTSPLSLASTALTLGSGLTAKTGLTGASRALSSANTAIGGATAAHGGYKMASGIGDRDLGEIGSGAFELAMGTLGARSGLDDIAELPKSLPDIEAPPEVKIPPPITRVRKARKPREPKQQSLGLIKPPKQNEDLTTVSDEFLARLAKYSKPAMEELERRKGTPSTPPSDLPAPLVSLSHKSGGEPNLLSSLSDEGGFIQFGGPRKAKPWRQGKAVLLGDKARAGEPRKLTILRPLYQAWTNARNAGRVGGARVREGFKDLDTEGMDAIFRFQAGDRSGRLSDLGKFFTDWHSALVASGQKLGFRENYLPQLWENSPDEIAQVFGKKRLGQKPKFALERIIEDYQEGIKKGLTPRFTTAGELAAWYERTASKNLADREFFNALLDAKVIAPEGSKRAAKDWVVLDPNHFPVRRIKTKNGSYATINFKAPPSVAKVIHNYLREPDTAFKTLADTAQLTKNLSLSAGFPGTALNAHGMNMLSRNTAARGILKGGMQAVKWMVNSGAKGKIAQTIERITPWESAAKYVARNLDEAQEFANHGMTLSTEEYKFGPDSKIFGTVFERGKNKLLDLHAENFEDPLFQNLVPALKIDFAKSVRDSLLKQGLDRTEATRAAARSANDTFGGMNFDELGMDKDFLNALRFTILAPDWAATHINLGRGLAKSLKNPKSPEFKAYRDTVVKGMLGMWLTGNIVNKMTSGHWMFQNDPGQTLNIEIGSTKTPEGREKKRYVNLFGTAADLIRLPIDALAGIAKGDTSAVGNIIKNRLSLPLRAGANAVLNIDSFGRPLRGTDAYGRDIPLMKELKGTGSELISPFIPQYVGPAARKLSGEDMSWEEVLMRSLELPLRYKSVRAPRGGGRSRPGRPQRRPNR